MGSERPDLGSGRPDLRSEKPDLGSERSDLESKRPDLGSERLYGGGWTDGRTDGKRKPEKIALYGIIGHRPLRGRCPIGTQFMCERCVSTTLLCLLTTFSTEFADWQNDLKSGAAEKEKLGPLLM